jgi:hypothetical protein
VRRAPIPVLLQKLCTRLACVKHAASVRSEPGSNSRLKLVAWRKKIPGFSSQAACQANYCRSIKLRPLALENSNGFEQILAHRIGCQRAKPSCPAERRTNNLKSISVPPRNVNNGLTFSTGFWRPALSSSICSRCGDFADSELKLREGPPSGRVKQPRLAEIASQQTDAPQEETKRRRTPWISGCLCSNSR